MSEPYPLPVGSYALPDPRASCRRLVNCFAQAAPQTPQLGASPADSKEKAPPVVLTRSAGITTLANDGTTNAVRGMWIMQGVVYAVIGPTLYSMSQQGSLTKLGTGISGGNGFVRMTDNKFCLTILIPGTNIGYTYTAGSGLTAITDPQFQTLGAIDLAFIDTYTLFLQQNGKGFYNDDGQAVSGTGPITFTTATQFLREFGTDLFVGMGIDHRQIMMLGTNTGEVYIDTGNAVGSPFSAAPDGFIELGCHPQAAYSIAKQDQSQYWVANDRTIRRRQGQTPLRASNHGIESILAKADFTGAYALTYSYLGHLFYTLTMPAISRTISLDVTTGEFHELSSFGLGYWRPLCALQAYGMQLVGDSQSGKIGYLDTTANTEFGASQTVSWTHQAVYSGNARISHRRAELVLASGEALTYVQNPLITMKVSNDGGNTFRTVASRSPGARGKYDTRMVWTNLGTSRQRVYHYEFSEPFMSTWAPDMLLDAVPGRF